MNAYSCPAPGFAKRSATYGEQIEACQRTPAPSHMPRLAADKALALGTAGILTPQERCLMMALLSHLHMGETASEQTRVWPGAKRLCRLLSIGESTLRRLKGALEEKGFLLRRYDAMNRPLQKGGIDLKPFLLKVPGLLGAIGEAVDLCNHERRAKKAERPDHGQEGACATPAHRSPPSARPPVSERPIEIPSTKLPTYAEGPETEEFAAQASLYEPKLANDPEPFAAGLFGETRGLRLYRWARERRGEACAKLALFIAARDEKLRDPGAWYGWYATHAEDFDLAPQAKRLLSAPKPLAEPQSLDDGSGRALREAEKAVPKEALQSYLTHAGEKGGALVLTTRSALATKRLKDRYGASLIAAAARAGFTEVLYRAAKKGRGLKPPAA